MAEQYNLRCFILPGGEKPVPIKIPSIRTVAALAYEIYPKTVGRFDLSSLRLYRVDATGVNEAIEKMRTLRLAEDKLDSLESLNTMYPSGPPEDKIHIVVQLPLEDSDEYTEMFGATYSDGKAGPESKRKGPRPFGEKSIMNSPNWCPYQGTVAAILELLLKHRIVQVRGPRASGKTTLLLLLHAHILKCHEDAEVFIYDRWPQRELESWEDRLRVLLPGYPTFDNKERFFLFDKGNTTYWDEDLWKAFKNKFQSAVRPVYAIIFCNYGYEDIRYPTPPKFDAKVVFDRVDNGVSNSYGLQLDHEEFRDVLDRQKKLFIEDDLRDFIFRFTRGHVGHTLAVVNCLVKKLGYPMLKGCSYSLKNFQQNNPSYGYLAEHLTWRSTVSRGVPHQPAPYTMAMKALLFHGQIDFNDEDIPQDILSKLKEAHELGFLDLNPANQYTFASPLQQQIWSWRLLPSPNYQLPYQDVFSFVKDTVARFRPSQLTGSDRPVGASDYRPREAQYQEEYYRCVHKVTDGNVQISPEYAAAAGTRAGRIDFLIPSKKWGIELTREGDKLDEHVSSFANKDAYEHWFQTPDMLDHILLDFRNTEPTKSYPGIRNLYHIVFNGDGTRLKIYDNKLDLRAEKDLTQRQV